MKQDILNFRSITLFSHLYLNVIFLASQVVIYKTASGPN
jgi:hypothetical protein